MKKLLIIIIFILTVVGAIASPTISKNYSKYATNILVSPEVANEMIKVKEDLIVLDVREEKDFEKGHIKGSYQIWRSDFSTDKEDDGHSGMRITPKKMSEVLSSYGITSDTHIMLLGAESDYEAARLWWILDMYGHENISIIDSGIDGWKSKGLELVKGKSSKPTIQGKYQFKNPIDLSKLATLEDVKAAITSNVVILDTRTNIEYDGLIKSDGAFTKGRIPNSYHIPWDLMINKDKTFKSSQEMKEILDSKGITKDMTIISYCQSGVRSAHMTFVLGELLGYKNVKNYDGSWVQWSYEYTQGNVEIEKDNIFKVLLSYITKRKKLESVITMLGVWGPLAFIIIYVLTTITMMPALPATIASGLIFGPIMGVVYTMIGAGIGLSLSFLIARYIARGAIERKFGESIIFKRIDEGVKKDGWFILAVTRLIPIFPFSVQNYVYGLTSIGFFQYSLLSVIFTLPGTSIYVMLAGAFVSGDKDIVLRYSITASLIFMGLMIVTKIIKKKWDFKNKD